MKNKIPNSIKKHKICIILVIILIMSLPFIILTPTECGFLEKTDAQTIVSYAGAIIGGVLTLIGVWWTIKYQSESLKDQEIKLNNQRVENLAIQYRPIMNIDYTENWKNETILKDKNNINLHFIIKNIGRGEAINYLIQCDEKIISEGYIYPAGHSSDLLIYNENIDFKKPEGQGILNITIKYFDLHEKNKYITKTKIEYTYKDLQMEKLKILNEYNKLL